MTRLTKPSKYQIKKRIDFFEKKWNFSDRLIYKGCLEEMYKINLCKIGEEDVRQIIRTFLINWGMMKRVLAHRKNWEKILAKKIREKSKILKNFVTRDLADFDLERSKSEIMQCYWSIRKIIAPTSASKLLHLVCPGLFPLWDVDIRKTIDKEVRKRGEPAINNSPESYYRFMREIQNLIRKYHDVFSQLGKQYRKSKVKLLDEYLWLVTRK